MFYALVPTLLPILGIQSKIFEVTSFEPIFTIVSYYYYYSKVPFVVNFNFLERNVRLYRKDEQLVNRLTANAKFYARTFVACVNLQNGFIQSVTNVTLMSYD